MQEKEQVLEAVQKRVAGQVAKNGWWLVLTESSQNPNKTWLHQCGDPVMQASISHPLWIFDTAGRDMISEIIPYCNSCEEKPSGRGLPIIDYKGI